MVESSRMHALQQISAAWQQTRNTKNADQVTTVGQESHYVKRQSGAQDFTGPARLPAGFFRASLPLLSPKAFSQPSEYPSVEPTRVMVTANALSQKAPYNTPPFYS